MITHTHTHTTNKKQNLKMFVCEHELLITLLMHLEYKITHLQHFEISNTATAVVSCKNNNNNNNTKYLTAQNLSLPAVACCHNDVYIHTCMCNPRTHSFLPITVIIICCPTPCCSVVELLDLHTFCFLPTGPKP